MCPFADDNGKLAFIIEPMTDFGVDDSLSAGNDACGRASKKARFGGKTFAHFIRMGSIILSDGNNF